MNILDIAITVEHATEADAQFMTTMQEKHGGWLIHTDMFISLMLKSVDAANACHADITAYLAEKTPCSQ